MRSSRVVRAFLVVNAKVATVLGSIPASSDTGAADEAVFYNVNKKEKRPNIVILLYLN
jgi:hypothetical protein